MTESTPLRRAALLGVASLAIGSSCGGDDPSPAASPAERDPTSSEVGDDADGEGEQAGQFGSARFTIDGTTYEWQSSCNAVRVVDGVTQPGAIITSAGLELTTGALMAFTMESDGASWSIDISNAETGEVWTLDDPVVSEAAGTYEVSGDAFSSSDSAPRPFGLTATCP